MLNRIKSLFADRGGGAEAESAESATSATSADELALASAALLVESACMDGDFDDAERQTITRILRGHFALSDEETETLIAEAERAVDHSGQLYGFTRVIKDRYSAAERIGMIEMLWEVAYADGRLDHFESNLISRVCGLIFVSDRDRGDARKRVVARLGIPSAPV